MSAPRLARDHTLSEEQWRKLDADFETAMAAEAAAKKDKAPATDAATEETTKPETSDGT